MGFFSFLTSEGISIPNHVSSRPTIDVWMVAPANVGCVTDAVFNDGITYRWYESFYGGFGDFANKDIYVLAAEMNGFVNEPGEPADDTKMRRIGIALMDEENDWVRTLKGMADPERALVTGTPPQHLAAIQKLLNGPREAMILPKLTINPNATWQELGPIQHCPHQGYFYDDAQDPDALWDQVPDESVRHIWKYEKYCLEKGHAEDETVTVDPSYYELSGTPTCGECGADLMYSHTEIKRQES